MVALVRERISDDEHIGMLQRLGGQGRIAGKLRDLDAALSFEPRSVVVHKHDGCYGRVANPGCQLNEVVERLLGRRIEDAVGEQRLEARRFGPADIDG